MLSAILGILFYLDLVKLLHGFFIAVLRQVIEWSGQGTAARKQRALLSKYKKGLIKNKLYPIEKTQESLPIGYSLK
ncbi:hypothetical protein BKP37_07680 [Anaerobacillus alkalilacustris]|uniref:Uncharacterized protein n=1 Tax=Anaerobacillus alkalilacustris TaxID=393763 RepID=A0A1S2LT52_9BACI|nr:hypothetical protein BKP37_07680 [Anaerobacillus alkalilacustris]